MSKTIPPLDLMFLLTETANSPKHVSGLITFQLPASGGAGLVRKIAAAYRAAKPVAPFTYVPSFPLTGMPRWKAAQAVDLDRHVHHIALPTGASHAELLKLVETLHETTLDRNRPGFDVFFIEGLPDNGFAMFVKLHHAIVDGASAMALLLAALNDAADEKRLEPFFAIELSAPRPRPPKGLIDRVMGMQGAARKQTSAIASLYVGMLKKGIGRLLPSRKTGSEPFAVARTPLNAPIRTPRSIATLSLPIAEMRAVGKAFEGTLNDVAVTIVDAGLHRYLQGIGKRATQPLVAMCPVSLREAGDKEVTTKVTAMFVPLGKPGASARERMQAVIAGIAAAKTELRAMSKDTAMLYAIAAFGLAEAEAELSQLSTAATKPLASFVLSNVPGAATPKYLNGARMTGMYPISALAAGMGMNVTLASYAGSMDFGFVGNGIALPDLPELVRHTQEAFVELKAAAAEMAPAAAKPAAQPKRAPAVTAAKAGAPKPKVRAAAKASGGRRR